MGTSKTFQTLFLGFRWSTTTCKPMSNVRLSVWRESVWPPASYEAKATKESILKRRKRKGKMFLCVVWSIKLRLIVMPTNLEYRERRRKTEKTESRTTGQRSSTRERTRAREKKRKGNIFCWRNNVKFCCSGEKMRNACFHLSKHERREKQKKHWTSTRTRFPPLNG